MAKVAVLCMEVWHCPECDTALKATRRETVVTSAEYHMLREHNVTAPSWDPPVERKHWAFNIHDELTKSALHALRPPGSPGAVGTT